MGTNQKYTPGPWKLKEGRAFETSSGVFYLSYGKDRCGNPLFRDFVELDANARLIASVPIMLNALQRIAAVEDAQLDPVSMRMLAQLALKEIGKQENRGTKEVACPDCYGGHFKPCNICGDSGVALVEVEGGAK